MKRIPPAAGIGIALVVTVIWVWQGLTQGDAGWMADGQEPAEGGLFANLPDRGPALDFLSRPVDPPPAAPSAPASNAGGSSEPLASAETASTASTAPMAAGAMAWVLTSGDRKQLPGPIASLAQVLLDRKGDLAERPALLLDRVSPDEVAQLLSAGLRKGIAPLIVEGEDLFPAARAVAEAREDAQLVLIGGPGMGTARRDSPAPELSWRHWEVATLAGAAAALALDPGLPIGFLDAVDADSGPAQSFEKAARLARGGAHSGPGEIRVAKPRSPAQATAPDLVALASGLAAWGAKAVLVRADCAAMPAILERLAQDGVASLSWCPGQPATVVPMGSLGRIGQDPAALLGLALTGDGLQPGLTLLGVQDGAQRLQVAPDAFSEDALARLEDFRATLNAESSTLDGR
ncbi:MAG: hypothetical protein ACPGOY_17455 [Rhodospirillaceae bacterium]